MKLFIPACGDRLILTEMWTFRLYLERRNMKFAKKYEFYVTSDTREQVYGVYDNRELVYVQAHLPAKTILECDRVYIRTFSKSAIKDDRDYDSITWRIINPKKDKVETNSRFWVKLSDANEIKYELQADSFYRDRVKLLKEVMNS